MFHQSVDRCHEQKPEPHQPECGCKEKSAQFAPNSAHKRELCSTVSRAPRRLLGRSFPDRPISTHRQARSPDRAEGCAMPQSNSAPRLPTTTQMRSSGTPTDARTAAPTRFAHTDRARALRRARTGAGRCRYARILCSDRTRRLGRTCCIFELVEESGAGRSRACTSHGKESLATGRRAEGHRYLTTSRSARRSSATQRDTSVSGSRSGSVPVRVHAVPGPDHTLAAFWPPSRPHPTPALPLFWQSQAARDHDSAGELTDGLLMVIGQLPRTCSRAPTGLLHVT